MKLRRLMLVIRHAIAMHRALSLPKNAAKGDWKDDHATKLLQLAKKELDELWAACWDMEAGKGSAQRVIEEAADLSAFAAFIADNARRREVTKWNS